MESSSLTSQGVEEIRKVQELTESRRHQSVETSRLFGDIVDSMQSSTQRIVTVEEEIKVLIQTIEGIVRTATLYRRNSLFCSVMVPF